jgi:NSS family neurotransmitter:Na+ symporter
MVSEFIVGRRAQTNAARAYGSLGRKEWRFVGYLGILTSTIILGFYAVVAGWCLQYLFASIGGQLSGDSAYVINYFKTFSSDPIRPCLWGVGFVLITHLVVSQGVNKGIERLSKILMPLLFIMLILMAIHMLFLDGGTTGLKFLFEPDFAKITPKVILEAMGLSFFTLSIGLGILITYGGYMPKEQNVTQTSLQMIILVIIVSLLAGAIVFPAVFAYGFSPKEGPELTFVTLPAVFQHMFAPTVTSTAFFALMCVAAITSTISMMEVMVAFFCEATASTKRPLSRHQSVMVVSAILMVTNILCILSRTGHANGLNIMHHNLFDNANTLVTNFLIPLGAFATAIYTGWFVPQARYQGSRVATAVYMLLLRWMIPIAIIIVFLNSLNIIR